MLKRICIMLIVLGLTTQVLSASRLTPRQTFYQHAHDGNISALKQLISKGNSIDLTDEYNNSALCESIYRQDYLAFAVLKQAGANIQHPCVSKIPSKTIKEFDQNYTHWANNFNSKRNIPVKAPRQIPQVAPVATTPNNTLRAPLAITKVPTTTGLSASEVVGITLGTALAGGGIALAVHGLAGHSGSSDNCSNFTDYSTSQEIEGCASSTPICSAEGITYYRCTSCDAGYTDGTNGKCERNDCSAYTGFSTSSSIAHCSTSKIICQSGSTKYYQCAVDCETGWTLNSVGKCSETDCSQYSSYSTSKTIEGCSGNGVSVCRSGNTTYWKCNSCNATDGWISGQNGGCTGAACTGYPLTTCPTDRAECDECPSAGSKKYKIAECIGDWNGDDCTGCSLTGHVDTEHCTCETAYSKTGKACDVCNVNGGYENQDGACINKCLNYSNYSTSATISHCSAQGTSVCSSGNVTYYKCDSCADGYVINANGKCVAASCTGYSSSTIDHCQTQLECLSGKNIKYKCEKCANGWVLSQNGSCVEDASCSGQTSSISNCAVENEICYKGTTAFYTCSACKLGYKGAACNECEEGYTSESGKCVKDMSCVSGISAWSQEEASENCASDKTTSCKEGLYQCTECTSGYTLVNGKCATTVAPEGNKIYAKKADVNADKTTSFVSVKNTTSTITDIYGLYGSAITKGANSDTTNAATSTISIFNGTQENPINANIYGITTSNSYAVYGAYANGSSANNNISIVNYGNGDIYGEYATNLAYGINAISGAEPSDPVANTITIYNTGSGTLYGIAGKTALYGAYNTSGNTPIQNTITLINNGQGDIYGLSSNGLTSDLLYGSYNYAAEKNTQNTLEIKASGGTNTEIYGAYSSGAAEGAHSSSSATNKTQNTIDINAETAKRVYGIYGILTSYGAYSSSTGETNNIIHLGSNRSFIDVSDILVAIRSNTSANGAYTYLQGKSTNEINIYATGTGNIYGLANFATSTVSNNNAAYAFSNGTAENNIQITYKGTGKVYGFYDAEETTENFAHGAYTTTGNAKNNIEISTTGDIETIAAGIYTKKALIGAESTSSGTSSNEISIQNTGGGVGNIYGLVSENSYLKGSSATTGNSTNTIEIKNLSRYADTYGMKAGTYADGALTSGSGNSTNEVTITNQGKGKVYGMSFGTGTSESYGANSQGTGEASNTLIINNTGGTHIYGMQGTKSFTGANATAGSVTNKIILTNDVSTFGNHSPEIYGMRTEGADITTDPVTLYGAKGAGTAKNSIQIKNYDNGKMFGMYGTNAALIGSMNTNSDNEIILINYGSGSAYGMYGKKITTSDNSSQSQNSVTIHSVSPVTDEVATGSAVGLRGTGSDIVNAENDTILINAVGGNYKKGSETIIATTDNTKAIGIYTTTGNVTNNGTITIKRVAYTDESDEITYTPTGTGGTAVGIYVLGDNSTTQTIENTGTINVSGFDYDNSYGIYVKNGEKVTVKNSGTIKINGASYAQGFTNVTQSNFDEDATGHGIYFENGSGSVLNLGTLSVQGNLNADAINLTLAAGSKTNVENAFYGTATVDADLTTHDFETVYTGKDMISAGDTSRLNLVSGSALFDANLQGNDVVMTMKGFDTATNNASLSSFLSKNYTLDNNEAFYNKLKSFGDISSLTDSLNKLTGKTILSRFNFEDMTMMRELNYDMNEKLFHNPAQHFALAGSVSPMAFRGDTGSNARYSLYNKRDGHKSIGLGIAFTNIYSDDNHDNNNRREMMYQLILPMGYKTHGFNLMTSPRIGYARGTYDRAGFDGTSYDGTIEKRMFGLMNEARYPINVGKWTFEPAAEFNILGYQQKGHEETKEFALNIQNQNTYSVEGGVGLYATREEELGKDTTLKMTAGLLAYHEFADPYKMRVGMEGMDGAFTLRDENRSDNRGVIRAGFDYKQGDYTLYGSFLSYIDKEWRTFTKTGLKVKF